MATLIDTTSEQIAHTEQAIDAAIVKAGKAAQQRYRQIVKALETDNPEQLQEASRVFLSEMSKGGALGRVLQAHYAWSQLATESEQDARNYPSAKSSPQEYVAPPLTLEDATNALQAAHDNATDEEYTRYLTALQMLMEAPKYSDEWRKVLRLIEKRIASQNAVGRLLAAHKALSVYGQIYPIIPLPFDTSKRN